MSHSPSNWSERIAKEFEVTLPVDLAAWFDQEVWKKSAQGYGEAVDPESLLDADSSTIWGGQMLPDTLPILTNGGGDVIAARFGFDGCVREYVEWQHMDSSWSPLGKTLAETLLHETARNCCRGGISDGFVSVPNDRSGLVDWALAHSPDLNLGKSFHALLEEHGPKGTLPQALVSHHIAEAAVLADVARTAMTSGLDRECLEVGEFELTEEAGVDWDDVEPWLFETKGMPQEILEKLAESTGKTAEELVARDSDTAEKAALRVLESRKDLAWPFAVLGWIAEERDDPKTAVEIYADGLWALGSTAGFTQDWMADLLGTRPKFCVKRLYTLYENGIEPGKDKDAAVQEYLTAADAEESKANFGVPVRDFWRNRVKTHESAGDHRLAYEACYAAGWDDMVANGMECILERLVHYAQAAESAGLASLAGHHLASMRR